MKRKWLLILLITAGSGWFTRELSIMANPYDITLFKFIVGPAAFLFSLGMVAGGILFWPSEQPERSTANRRPGQNVPTGQPVREPTGRSYPRW